MNFLLTLTLTFCLTLTITEEFLLPRDMNLGKAIDDDQEKRYVMRKNAALELEFLITLVQAFESHQKIVDLLDSLMKSKPVSEVIEIGLQPCSDTATMLLSKYC